MPASMEVLVWLEQREYDALKKALQASGIDSVEREAERLLRQRYEQLVPKEQREQIEAQLQKEMELETREREAARRYSAVRITEGGISRYFEADNMDMLSHAYALRRHLRGEYGESTLAQEYELGRSIEIDNARYEQHQSAFGHSKNLTGLYDIDLDNGVFTLWNPETGQPASYATKDVSTAAYFASRSASRFDKYKAQIFLDRLDGKELTDTEPEPEDGPKLEM